MKGDVAAAHYLRPLHPAAATFSAAGEDARRIRSLHSAFPLRYYATDLTFT